MSTFGTALDETPSNLNFLSPLVFTMQIKRAPNLKYFVQNVNLPGIHMDPFEQGNKFVTIPHPGEHLTFDELTVNFKVQETMDNWLEIYDWLIALGFPKQHSQYAALTTSEIGTDQGVKSDISLIAFDSDRNVKFNVLFHDAFPITLSSIIFDQATQDLNYVTAAATFKYTRYEIERVNV